MRILKALIIMALAANPVASSSRMIRNPTAYNDGGDSGRISSVKAGGRIAMRASSVAMSSAMIGGVGNHNLIATGTEYHNIHYGADRDYETSAAAARSYVQANGKIRNLLVKVSNNPSGSWVFTVFKNGAATELSCTTSGSNQTCSDVSVIPVSAGDSLSMQVVGAGGAVSTKGNWSTIFDAYDKGVSVMGGGGHNFGLSAASTRYLTFGCQAPSGVEEPQLIAVTGTVSKMKISISAAPGAGKSYTFTARKNGSNTTLTCAISGASDTSCEDTTNSFTISPADRLTYSVVPAGTPTVVSPTGSGIVFTADTNKEFNITKGANGNMNNAGQSFQHLAGGGVADWPSSGESSFFVPPPVMTFKAIYARTGTAPTAGRSYTFNLREGSSNGDLNCIVADTNTTCTASADVLTATSDERNNMSQASGTPVSTPGEVAYRVVMQ